MVAARLDMREGERRRTDHEVKRCAAGGRPLAAVILRFGCFGPCFGRLILHMQHAIWRRSRRHKKCNMAAFAMTRAQCRAARALIDWSREQLATASKVGLRTLVDFERGAREPREVTVDSLRRALESAGVEFIPENGGGAGVRLRDQGITIEFR